jgi:hypothetical protein
MLDDTLWLYVENRFGAITLDGKLAKLPVAPQACTDTGFLELTAAELGKHRVFIDLTNEPANLVELYLARIKQLLKDQQCKASFIVLVKAQTNSLYWKLGMDAAKHLYFLAGKLYLHDRSKAVSFPVAMLSYQGDIKGGPLVLCLNMDEQEAAPSDYDRMRTLYARSKTPVV